MGALGVLAGGVAHDFNNMLTIVLGYSELLMGRLDAESPDRRALEEIRIAGQRASALTRQLLVFSRKQVVETRPLWPNESVEGLGKMLTQLIDEDIEMEMRLMPDTGMVSADPGQVDQVIINLAVNARDAMPQGGRLVIETENVHLDTGDFVRLAISDTGCGMESEVMDRIFEPFFTTKEADKGTCLGLSTVLGIVKQSGGHIEVQSVPGEGSVFSVYLPCVACTFQTSVADEMTLAGEGNGETIFLAEVDAGARTVLATILRTKGYTVLEAKNGVEALEGYLPAADSIHLVITDVIMPQMGGTEWVQRIKTRNPKVKVMFISGCTDDWLKDTETLLKDAAFLHKPFSPEAFLRKVSETLQPMDA